MADDISALILRAIEAATRPPVRSAVSGTLPPLYNPANPRNLGPIPSPAVDPMMAAGAYDDPAGPMGGRAAPGGAAPGGLLGPVPAPAQPGAGMGSGGNGAMAPAGLLNSPHPLAAPQPLSPMVGAPQAVSPLVVGGRLPPVPAGGLGSQPGGNGQGGGFWEFLANPELSRGLIEAGMRMLGASAPSLDPRSGSLGYAVSQGLGGYMKGQDDFREGQAQAADREMNAAYKAAMIEELMRPPQVEIPSLQTTFDPQGREIRGYLDPAGNFVQVGGAKAPAGMGAGGVGGGVGSPTTLSGSLTTKDKQIINSIPSLRGAVDAYEAALASTDAGWFDRAAAGLGFAGPEAVKLEALRTQVIMQLKELQGLGAKRRQACGSDLRQHACQCVSGNDVRLWR